ncbi:hypothetical protein BGZ60DRAFT_411098 [Tricladium varicosporioides]|nr:hypothetical protein BGZ60DRAFT_411098 [Hymenoscyphus varicosporioides]
MYIILATSLLALVSSTYCTIGDSCKSGDATGICQSVENCKGVTVNNACPHDPSSVKCCIQTPCSLDQFSGTCGNMTLPAWSTCVDGSTGDFVPGYCRGSKVIQCCVPHDISLPAKFRDAVLGYWRNVEEYNSKESNDVLVMDWVRHLDYNGWAFRIVLREIPQKFLDFMEKTAAPVFPKFQDPLFPNTNFDDSHWAASALGHLLFEQPSGNGVNRGDFVGWGGDLITFYGDWRKEYKKSKMNGHDFCMAKFARHQGTTFDLEDLVSDSAAYNMGHYLRTTTALHLPDLVTLDFVPGGDYRTRIARFVEGRFGNDKKKIYAVAKEMLTGGPMGPGQTIPVLRDGLLNRNYDIWPWSGEYPSQINNLEPFLQGFADVLMIRVSEEKANISPTLSPTSGGIGEPTAITQSPPLPSSSGGIGEPTAITQTPPTPSTSGEIGEPTAVTQTPPSSTLPTLPTFTSCSPTSISPPDSCSTLPIITTSPCTTIQPCETPTPTTPSCPPCPCHPHHWDDGSGHCPHGSSKSRFGKYYKTTLSCRKGVGCYSTF